MRLSILVLLASSAAIALTLTGRVVDEAGLLSHDESAKLEAMLESHEKATTNQIVVVTVKSLNNIPIEDFGYQLGRQWGIGTKEKNNGVLLIVAPKERQVRIEVAYGLEGVLTDAQSKMIIERAILPQFRAGKMGEGVLQGTQKIIDVLGGTPEIPTAHEQDEDSESINPWLLFGILVVMLIIFRFMRRGGGPGSRFGGMPFFWNRGGGSSDRGGFRGGGGTFGGGGASGRW